MTVIDRAHCLSDRRAGPRGTVLADPGCDRIAGVPR